MAFPSDRGFFKIQVWVLICVVGRYKEGRHSARRLVSSTSWGFYVKVSQVSSWATQVSVYQYNKSFNRTFYVMAFATQILRHAIKTAPPCGFRLPVNFYGIWVIFLHFLSKSRHKINGVSWYLFLSFMLFKMGNILLLSHILNGSACALKWQGSK